MERELIGYKEKVENMKLLVKHYQAQLESQKVRRDGVETVSRLLAESRQENVKLKQNHAAMETLIRNLQNRLAVNGLPTSVEEEDEVIVPTMSRQTLQNLALENKRLRALLQKDGSGNGSAGIGNSLGSSVCNSNNSSDPVETLDSGQKNKEIQEIDPSSQQTIDKLEAENKSMKMKLFDLEALFKSSNNQKDRQLITYQEEIASLQQQHAVAGTTREGDGMGVLPGLREQLRSLALQCQNLEGQLGKAEGRNQLNMSGNVELIPVVSSSQDTVDGAELKQLREEKEKLQEKVEEVTGMNKRWQDYMSERDRFTADLEAQVHELQVRLKEAEHAASSGAPSAEVQRQVEQHLAMTEEKVRNMDRLRIQAEQETDRLTRLLAEKDAEIAHLRNEVTILSQRAPGADTGTIEHLRAQIQVCTEDFEKERQDRQAALQKINSLQEQMTRLQKLNSHLQTMVCNQAGPSRSAPQEHSHPQHQNHGLGSNLQPRGGHYTSALDYDCSPPSPNVLTTGSRAGQKDLCDPMLDFPDFDFETPAQTHTSQWELPTQHNNLSRPGGPISMPGTSVELLARSPASSSSSSARPKHSASASDLTPHLADAGKHDNFLTCPKCNKEFSEEHQGELLAHMDVCWE